MEGQNMCNCKPCEWMKNHRIWKKIIVIVLAIIVIVGIVKCFGWNGGDKNSEQDTIVVSGKGEVIVKPDIATVDFSVMQENLDVSKASDAVNAKITDIMNALKVDGVDEADIKTTDYSVYPRYNYVNQATPSSVIYPGGTQVLAGYDVTESIEVKIRDLTKAGKIITDLGTLKVTDMSGLNFTNDKYDDLVKQARDAAIADARDQADKLAKALGVRLVKIVGYSENGNTPIYYAKADMVTMGANSVAAPSAVLPTGENKIDSNVSITYEIK